MAEDGVLPRSPVTLMDIVIKIIRRYLEFARGESHLPCSFNLVARSFGILGKANPASWKRRRAFSMSLIATSPAATQFA
jgi:hypothetical protein